MKRILCLPVVAIALSACSAKISSNSVPVQPKPLTCTRTLVREVPAEFKGEGTVTGTVRTFNCESVVVASNRNGEVYLAKFKTDGTLDTEYGDRGYFKPLMNRHSGGQPRIERLAVINEGFMALGTHGNDTRAFLAFRFADDGYLDLGFGPTKEGVLRAVPEVNVSVIRVGAPTVDNGVVRIPLRVEDREKGTEADREVSFPLDGKTIQ